MIDNLKRGIRSLPSTDGRECLLPVVADASVLERSADSVPTTCVAAPQPTTKDKFVRGFVRHGMLTAEFFFFFLILLSVSRPSFLYRNERVVRNGREMWRTQFSTTCLVSYSAFFTLCVHALMMIQKDVAKRY